MDIRLASILFLIEINSVYCREHFIGMDKPDEVGLNPNEFSTLTESGVQFVLRSKDTHQQQPSERSPTKYCRSFQNCFECSRSTWFPCVWCHEYGCTDFKDKICTTSTKPTGYGNISSCPYIHSRKPILVPSGIRRHLQVRVNVPDPALLDNDLICQIKLKNQMKLLKGIIVRNTLYCFPVTLNVKEGTEVGSFAVLWGGIEPLSNEIPLIIYRCDVMGNRCEDCRRLPSNYRCGWCDENQTCSVREKCNDPVSWSLNKITCMFKNSQMYFV